MHSINTMTFSGISRKLIIYILIFSTALTLIITCAQLYRDYRTDISLLDQQMQQIEDAHISSLTESLWSSDMKVLSSHAEGILELRDMQYIEIRDKDRIWLKHGIKEGEAVISNSFPLIYKYRGRNIEIGEVTVIASLEGVYQRLLDKVITILVSNALKTFLVSIFIFFVFHRLVTRHLHQVAQYSQTIDFHNLNQRLHLERNPSDKANPDELDILVNSINDMSFRLKKSLEAQNKSNEHYRSLVESSYAIPWEVDIATFCFTFVGPQAKNILGYEAEDWYQENFWANNIHPEDRDDALAYCQLETSEGRDHRFEYRMKSKDGHYIWLRDDVIVIKEEGKPVRLQGYMFDITSRKNAELELQHAYDDLEEKVKARTRDLSHATEIAEKASHAKTEFLSRVSHELRTPLNAVLGYAQLLELELANDTSGTEFVQYILKGGQHLLVLIEEVLDLSRIELGKININIDNTGLHDIIDEVIQYTKPHSDQRNISIHLKGAYDARVLADEMRLKEILLNLLSNAVKYNNDNGSITIDCAVTDDNHCSISVIDTGPGMTEEQLALVFEPFSRLGAEYTGIEGSGIGLTISRKLATLMESDLTVKSEPGVGSEFILSIPLATEDITIEQTHKTGSQG